MESSKTIDLAGTCRIDLSGLYLPDNLAESFTNFKTSSTPSRFLHFSDSAWSDLPIDVFNELLTGFSAGNTTVEAAVNGVAHLFDFLQLTQTDLSTGTQRSIAWIDVDGCCFFPRSHKLEIAIRIAPPEVVSDPLKRKRESPSYCSPNEYSDESPESSSTAEFNGPRWSGTKKLGEGDRFYKVVEKLFLSGIRGVAPDTVITSISKCVPSSPAWNSRHQTFQRQMQTVKAARGDANLKFGWYGAPAADIPGVIAHGFTNTNSEFLGPDAHGVGVHLSPPHSPHTSCVFSEADSNGERHLVLCRAIMGRPEEIPAGSCQFWPGSDEFDSGVDDLVNPKWYIVWDDHRSTHIHPEYVVSFKTSKQFQGPWRRTDYADSPRMSFTELMPELGKSLPSERMQEVLMLHNLLKAGKISRENFIGCIRSIAGDKVLTSIVKGIRVR